MTGRPVEIAAGLGEAGLGAAKRAWRATGWTGQHLRHVAGLVVPGRNPAARVYESIGSDCFVALAPGWLNLGLWDGPGTEEEAGAACRVIAPALRVIAARLARSPQAPLGHRTAARVLLWQVELLWRHRIIDYLMLRATRPA